MVETDVTEEEAVKELSDYLMSADGKVNPANMTNVLMCVIVLLSKSIAVGGKPFAETLVKVIVDAHGMLEDHEHRN